jgi:hypothetical protein
MFIGHFAVALAAKRLAPRTSLGALTLAAQLTDLVWPILLLAGLERVEVDPGNTLVTPLAFTHYPITHSLLAVLGWALLAAAVAYAWQRERRAALVIGALVLSHWVLDLVTHSPDLPLLPTDSPKVGLGLWNSLAGTLIVEGGLFLAGLWLYGLATRAKDGVGRWAFFAYAAVLTTSYIVNLTSPPPPSAAAIGAAGLALWLFPLWAHWFDRHREPRAGTAAGSAAGLPAEQAARGASR